MTERALFELPDPGPQPKPTLRRPDAAPRIRCAERRQVRLLPTSLDALWAEDHPARAVWAYVDRLDLSGLYGGIRSVDGCAGRPATDPKILLSLWVYATIDGVGSARALARFCEAHVAYRWICGGVEGRARDAIARNRGLQRFLTRGLQSAKCVALLYALTHNIARTFTLAA